MDHDRLERQIDFLLEIDGLKEVVRRTYLVSGRRRENSAEHSWHLAIAAMLLAEHAAEPVDVARVAAMVLVHDVVEIDAGDTFVYDTEASAGKADRERAAAGRLFGLLPADQGSTLRALWDEFEARSTPEARFAQALDRLLPVLHNIHTAGRAWRENGITADRVLERNGHIAEGSPILWQAVRRLVERAVSRGEVEPGSGEAR
ncbi:MAG: HD domain-containing protein [Acidobacteriota bacterium]